MEEASILAPVGREVSPDFDKLPKLKRLVEELAGQGSPFQDAKRTAELFSDFVQAREYEVVVGRGIEALVQEGDTLPDFAIRNLVVIFQNSDFQIYLQRIRAGNGEVDPGSDTIVSSPGNTLTSVVSTGAPLKLTRYSLPAGTDLAIFNKDCRLVERDTASLVIGDDPYLCRTGDVLQVESRDDLVIAKLVDNRIVPFVWAFDSRSLLPKFMCSSVPSLTRFETLIDLGLELRANGDEPPAFADLLEVASGHPMHFVRWKAIQGLGRVAPQRAIQTLARSVNDPHPDIRRAASAALANLV